MSNGLSALTGKLLPNYKWIKKRLPAFTRYAGHEKGPVRRKWNEHSTSSTLSLRVLPLLTYKGEAQI